jgi:hypothetical protein
MAPEPSTIVLAVSWEAIVVVQRKKINKEFVNP